MIPRLQPRRPDRPSEGLENMMSTRTNANAAPSSVLPVDSFGFGRLANHSARNLKSSSNVNSTISTEGSSRRSSLSVGSSLPLGMRPEPSKSNHQQGHQQASTSCTGQSSMPNLETPLPTQSQDMMVHHDRHAQPQHKESSSKHPELPKDLQRAMDELQSPAHSFSSVSSRSFSSLSCSSADSTPTSKLYYTSPLEEASSRYGSIGAGDTESATSSAASASASSMSLSSSSPHSNTSSSYHTRTLQQSCDLQGGNGIAGGGSVDGDSDDVASLTLTPPLAPWNHPPLIVSAKRHGSDVRRQHSKRRRRGRRRRRPKHPSESNTDSDSNAARNTTGGDYVSQIMGRAGGRSMDDDGTEAKRLWGDEDINDEDGAIGGILAQTAAAATTGAEASLMPDSSDEDNDDDDDESDNLQLLFDPKEVSPEQANMKYWEWCYGKGSSTDMHYGAAEGLVASSFSASRAPPQKGCLSVAKSKRNFRAKGTHKSVGYRTPPASPEELVLVQASSIVLVGKSVTINDVADDGDNSTKTFKVNNTTRNAITSKTKKQRHVQFGSPTAVEYVIGEPAKQLTPLPNEVTRKRYSMDEKKATVEEEELTIETKHNTSILAEWEDDCEVKGRLGDPRRRRGDSAGANGSRNRRRSNGGRRSSSIFSPSPMCLLEADTVKSLSSREGCIQEEEEKEDDQVALPVAPSMEPEKSPSVLMAANLASLRMSPDEVSHKNTSAAAAPTCSAGLSPTGNDNTWEGFVDLGSVNVSGGAMDVSRRTPVPPLPCNNSITPMPQSTSTVGAHLTPPPANGTMDAIHSLGGAMDEETISPTFMSSMSQNYKSPSLNRRPPTPAAVKAIETAPTGSSGPFLGSPRLDQSVEFGEVLRELSFSSPPSDFSSPVARLLSTVDPSMDWILQSLDDLMHRAITPSGDQVVALTAVDVEQKVIGGWNSLEIEFLEELLYRLKIAELELIESCHDLDEALPLPVQAPTCESLEREVGRLELEVTLERHEMDLQEASFGRQYALLCQATERLCLHGFYVEQFDDENKELCFENHTSKRGGMHRIILNLESTENVLKLKPSASDGESFLRPSSQAAILNNLFSSFLNMLMGDSSPLLHGLLQCRDMQDCYLKIARWLDLLVRFARDLDAMQGKISVSINLPHCTVTVLPSQTATIYFAMDPVTDSISSEVSVSRSDSFEVVTDCHGLSDWSLLAFV